jgi:TPR repeat protein
MDDGVLSNATMEIVGKLILEFERIKQEKQRRGEQLQQRTEMLKEAFRCFEKGHQLDRASPELLYCLADSYYRGDGVQENEERALALYQRAADMGYAEAQTAIGDAHSQCKFSCVPLDEVQAAKWYALAAEQGEEEALSMILAMYQRGEGVEQNHAEAARILRKAAAKGVEYALDELRQSAEFYGSPYDDSDSEEPSNLESSKQPEQPTPKN